MQLFDPDKASSVWNRLSSKYSFKYHKQLSAWSRLSYHMRHSYNRFYDGGLLRVIAFFGESFPEYLSKDEVVFQAGPVTASISVNLNSNRNTDHYLLIRMAMVFSEDEHLHHYIKEYTNAYHEKSKPADSITMFDQLHDILTDELMEAEKEKDYSIINKLTQLADMMSSLCSIDI